MAKDTTTVTVGAVRELTSQEIEERDAVAGKGAAPSPRDPREAHAQAVELSKLGEKEDIFATWDLVPTGGVTEDTTETTTTTTKTPRSVTNPEPEKLVNVKLLVDWRDGQGLLHEHGEALDLPPNEAKKLLEDRRAERTDPPKEEDRTKPTPAKKSTAK
jgi:hypothetical protein